MCNIISEIILYTHSSRIRSGNCHLCCLLLGYLRIFNVTLCQVIICPAPKISQMLLMVNSNGLLSLLSVYYLACLQTLHWQKRPPTLFNSMTVMLQTAPLATLPSQGPNQFESKLNQLIWLYQALLLGTLHTSLQNVVGHQFHQTLESKWEKSLLLRHRLKSTNWRKVHLKLNWFCLHRNLGNSFSPNLNDNC